MTDRQPVNNAEPFHRARNLFALHPLHNHASCVVQCPNGDLLACWYRGSGERKADDVSILGARKPSGAESWSEPFVMADVPGFPDCNPCMLVDPRGCLWLFWVTVQANEWYTALLKYRVSWEYEQAAGPPAWRWEQVIHLKPEEEFTRVVHGAVDRDLGRLDTLPEETRERARDYLERRRRQAADTYFSRLGWMPRARPFVLEGSRLILPLYSDGFDFSLMAITDDWGETWETSLPLVGDGNVQPTLVQRRDGTLVAYMRDNGRPPKRLIRSESSDRGATWTPVYDTEIPNPGSGVEVVRLNSGRWALINNDTERGRHRLTVSLSEDEGRSWPWTRALEQDAPGEGAGSYSYPSLLQAADGSLHATYTVHAAARDVQHDAEGRPLRNTIRHAHFNEAWLMAGGS